LPPPTHPQILPEFFKHFWVRRMALDRRNYRALVETTVEIAGKVCVHLCVPGMRTLSALGLEAEDGRSSRALVAVKAML